MRKVLFATTALVALGGVSAASADISVSAGNEFKYSSWSDSYAASTTANKTSAGSTTKYKISASTVTDNGLTLSSYTAQDATTGSFNDMGFSIAGDFGTIGFAGSEAGDAFETDSAVTADEGNSILTGTTTALAQLMPGKSANGGSTVSYKSPDMSGFQFAVGMSEVGYTDGSQMGAQYSMTSGDTTVTLKYAVDNQGTTSSAATEIEATSAGIVVAYGDATVTISSKDGVIKPERPKMSASLSLTAFKMSSHGHMTPISTTLKLLQPNTTATMFLPMSCTSPFTVAIKKVPAVDASVLPVAAFSASMNGMR